MEHLYNNGSDRFKLTVILFWNCLTSIITAENYSSFKGTKFLLLHLHSPWEHSLEQIYIVKC